MNFATRNQASDIWCSVWGFVLWDECRIGIPGPGSRLAPPCNFSLEVSGSASVAADAEFPGALMSQFTIERRSVLRSSLVGTAPRESGTPIFALYGFPTLGSIHLASTTPSFLASCYTTTTTSPSPTQPVFHPVEKDTEISIRRSSRVALRGLIGAALARCGEAAHTFFPICFDSYVGRADAEIGKGLGYHRHRRGQHGELERRGRVRDRKTCEVRG
jgi:hypothetical protein